MSEQYASIEDSTDGRAWRGARRKHRVRTSVGMRHVLVLASSLLLVACGSSGSSPPPEAAYDGPMVVSQDFKDDAIVLERAGAAGKALECRGDPYDGGGGDYTSGLEKTQSSAVAAIDNFLLEEAPLTSDPDVDEFRLECKDGGRALYSYDTNRRTMIALTLSDTIKDYRGKSGWGVESWAQCDPAELPNSDSVDGVQVWTDARGDRVPSTTIQSYAGAEHCDWQSITFVQIGDDIERVFVRDLAGVLAEHVYGSYDPSTVLPANAKDSGFRRAGRELWQVRGGREIYLVKTGNRADVEEWPQSRGPIGCK